MLYRSGNWGCCVRWNPHMMLMIYYSESEKRRALSILNLNWYAINTVVLKWKGIIDLS